MHPAAVAALRLVTGGPLLAAAPGGPGWRQVGELGLALVLSAAVGLEREMRQKSAGLRTHSLVGLGAALFMLVSKYGFMDVLETGRVVVDPSRVAAQIVSGIGFLGAGLIFVRRDSVRGLTTAAAVWVTAAIGACAGAGLVVLAVVATAGYFVVALVLGPVSRRLPLSPTAVSVLHVRYPDGHGVLRQLLGITTDRGFTIDNVATQVLEPGRPGHDGALAGVDGRVVEAALHVHGQASVRDLAVALSELPGVHAVEAADANVVGE